MESTQPLQNDEIPCNTQHVTGVESGEIGTREGVTKRLVDCYERCLNTSVLEVVLILGPSGVGKTSLALSVNDVVSARGGNLIYGKFDQLAYMYEASTTLYQPFVDAFTSYIEAAIDTGKGAVAVLRETLELAMDSTELQVLRDMIPVLGKILRPSKSRDTSMPVIKGPDAESRFVRIFGIFVQAITSLGKPIVLLLDDLQWANQSDFKLLASLAQHGKGCKKSRLMVLCTGRTDEPPLHHPCSDLVGSIKGHGASVTEIRVNNMSEAEVSTILSRALHLPLVDTCRLSKIVFKQTEGNVLFVNMLVNEFKEGVLSQFSNNHLDGIHSVLNHHCQSVDQLVERKVQRLPRKEQELLKMASCLGSRFSEEVITAISSESSDEVALTICALQNAGLITFDQKSKIGRFVHDRFQRAAYLLIPECKRAPYHLHFGKTLWQSLPRESRNGNLLLIGHQISRGAHLLNCPGEKSNAAEILSWAGQKAALSSAFASASSFLCLGISLLSGDRWSQNYDLCLRLYSFAAEIEYYNGKLYLVDELVAEVLLRARSFEDKLRCHFTRIYSLGSRNEMAQALDESMHVFRCLGESFPRNPRVVNIVAGLIRCNHILHDKSDDYILSLPQMRDWKKLAAMRLMTVVGLFAFYARDKLLPLLVFRLVNITLKYGMSDIACAGFAMLAHLYAQIGDVGKACRYSRLALRIFKKYEAKEWQTRVVLTIYGSVYPLKHPYHKLLGPLKDAHRVGLVVGDLHFSMVSAVISADYSYFSGVRLATIAEELNTYRSICKQYKQISVLAPVELHLQFCLNLMGRSRNPLVLTGDVMVEEDVMAIMQQKNTTYFAWLHVLKLTLAIFMNNLPVAQDMSCRLKHLAFHKMVKSHMAAYLFFDGMTAALSSRISLNEKRRAFRILGQLKKFADNAPMNFLHRVYLVEAEIATSLGKRDEAIVKFQQSIMLARQHKLIHEQALACERASYALQRWQRPSESKEYLLQAQTLYEEWGATAKTVQLAGLL